MERNKFNEAIKLDKQIKELKNRIELLDEVLENLNDENIDGNVGFRLYKSGLNYDIYVRFTNDVKEEPYKLSKKEVSLIVRTVRAKLNRRLLECERKFKEL